MVELAADTSYTYNLSRLSLMDTFINYFKQKQNACIAYKKK